MYIVNLSLQAALRPREKQDINILLIKVTKEVQSGISNLQGYKMFRVYGLL